MLTSHRFSCSLGTISLYFEDEDLIGLDLEGSAGCGERLMAQLARHGIDPAAFRPEATPAALAVEQWLINYAAGSKDPFTLPRKLYGTPFQISVWNALEALGYDEVISYAKLARRVGSNGYRAVGTAVGHNPIPIIIPCHRIVRQDGIIGRFGAGDGTETKRKLLRLEGHSY